MISSFFNRSFRCFVILVLSFLLSPMEALAVKVIQVVSPIHKISAWLVEDHTNPLIGLGFGFKVGAKSDPLGKEGLAALTTALLEEGAGDKDSRAFNAQLEDYGIKMRFGSNSDYITGQLLTLTEHRTQAADMLKLALSQPRFEVKEIEKVRKQILTQINNLEMEPGYIATVALSEKAFPNHPYGRSKLGNIKSISAINRDDIVNFHKNFTLDRLMVVATGDITPTQLGEMLDSIFQDLKKTAPLSGSIPDVEPKIDGSVLVKTLDIPQTTLLCLQKGISVNDPRFPTLMVLNNVLGDGILQSRLFKEIRERRGLAYAVNTWPVTQTHANFLEAYVATENSKVAQTLELLKAEWQRLKDDGLTKEELEDAKKYLMGSYALRFTNTSQICSLLLFYRLDGLDLDYVNERNKKIEDVTLDKANALARTFLTPEKLTCIAVGKPQGLKE